MGKRLVLREAVEAIQGQGLWVVCEAVVCEAVVAIQGRLCEVVAIQGLDQHRVRLDQHRVRLDQHRVRLDLHRVRLDLHRVRLDRLDHVGEGRIRLQFLSLGRLFQFLKLRSRLPPPHLSLLPRLQLLQLLSRNLLKEHVPPRLNGHNMINRPTPWIASEWTPIRAQ